ncbi:hypothetical protein BS78_08G111900 [Paspalum vaginatum]|nr:hypothetical protein BS78_08G111900 [Paspalum vaginatum]
MKQGLRAAPEIRLSIRIQEQALSLVLQRKDRRIIPDVIHDCFKCITKEAELILERLRKGFEWRHVDNILSHDIRAQVFRLAKKYLRADPCSASVPTRAVLLGITKEAELICKKMRQEGCVSMGENAMSRDIRSDALDTLMNSNMDKFVRKRRRTAGFCYRHYIDPAVTDIPTCHEKELGDVHAAQEELDEVHATSGSRGLRNENCLAKTELEENMIVQCVWRTGLVSSVE